MNLIIPSVEILVLVLLLLKVRATVLPVKAPVRFCGIEPDLMAFLWDAAFLTKVVNSFGVKSAIVMRCLGAFVAGVEYERTAFRRTDEAIVGRIDGILIWTLWIWVRE
jgi:hypothetical protein